MDEHRDICVNGHLDPPRHTVSRNCKLCQRERSRGKYQRLSTAQRSDHVRQYRARLRDEVRAAYAPVVCSLCGSTFQCSLEYVGTEPLPRKGTYAAARALGFPPQFRWVCAACLTRRAIDTQSNRVV